MRSTSEICSEIASLAQTYLELEKWGYRESTRVNEVDGLKIPSVIYDSPWCRVRISFSEWHPPHQTQDYTVDVYYARLGTPDDKTTMIWNDEECYCWHGVVKALHFLDKSTPEYTAQNIFSHNLIKQFRRELRSKDLEYKLPEWEVRKHAYIWASYAPGLFELFDIPHSELWHRYQQFVKDVYAIKGHNPIINPPLDKIC